MITSRRGAQRRRTVTVRALRQAARLTLTGMACDVVSAVILSLPSRKELKIQSPRVAAVKKCAEDVLEACSKERNKDRFAIFSAELLKLLKRIVDIPGPATLSQRRERLWVSFAKIRAERLPTLWKRFLQDIGCASSIEEPLLMELTNESLLESMAKDMYSIPQPEERTPTCDMYLSKDEQNIIRYACGYVGMKLHNQFVKQPGEKAASFVECIDYMHAVGPSSSLLEYTREWIDKVNRGGLFDVSDEAFHLFVAIEMAMRDRLATHLQSSSTQDSKGKIVDHVIGDCDVQFYWSLLSVDIRDDKDSLELLRRVVELWLTIRGYSMSKMWMENYKCTVNTTTKGKKGLRKDLKKQTQAAPQ